MSNGAQEPVTLPVAHLSASTSFYLSALQPLGYRFLHQLQHPNGTLSQAIGLGPESGHRVDLYLAQAGRRAAKRAHVVFPATSKAAVDRFYEAALGAGGRPIRSPDTQPGGLYTAVVSDLDGNKVEVALTDDFPEQQNQTRDVVAQTRRSPEPAKQNTSIGRWAADVASSAGSLDDERSRSGTARNEHATAMSPKGSSRPRAVSGKSSSGRSNGRSSDIPSKAVVGTLFGGATTAAIAYAVLQSQDDSRRKQAAYSKRTKDRGRLEAEARASRSQETPSRSTSKPLRTTDRDSGYYSSASRKDDSPRRWRSVSYGQPSGRRDPAPGNLPRSSTMPLDGRYAASKSGASTARPSGPPSPPGRSLFETEARRVPRDAPPRDAPPRETRRESRRTEREPPPSGRTIFDEDDDVSTVVPEDSISCAGSPPPRRRRSGKKAGSGRRRELVIG